MITIRDLGLSMRAENALWQYYGQADGFLGRAAVGIMNIEAKSLLRLRNCGPKTVREIAERLKAKTGLDWYLTPPVCPHCKRPWPLNEP